MRNDWLISDTHFGHANLLTFKDGAGMHVRPGFKDVEEMDETLIQRWNEVVKDGDHVYHLGDVSFVKGPRLDAIMSRLKGKKRLLLGNHDQIKDQSLFKYFPKIGLWRHFSDHKFICSHIPLPLDQFRYKCVLNVHGHIHEKADPSVHHMNVSVEVTDYRPVHVDEVLKVIEERGL